MTRSVILIDGSNVYSTVKALGFSIDYKKLLDTIGGDGVHKAYYFTALRAAHLESAVKPMIDYLDYNGWTCITKPTQEWMQSDGKNKIKGNMDIEIACIANEVAPHVDHIYLFSGDGDFRYLVESIQRRFCVVVHVVSSIKTDPPMCADALRRQADHFIDLADIQHLIQRDETSPTEPRRIFRRS